MARGPPGWHILGTGPFLPALTLSSLALTEIEEAAGLGWAGLGLQEQVESEREVSPRNQDGGCWVEKLAPEGLYGVPRKGFFKELVFAISSKYGLRRKQASRRA